MLKAKSLTQNIIAITGYTLIFLGAKFYFDEWVTKHPILFIILGGILFIYSKKLANMMFPNSE